MFTRRHLIKAAGAGLALTGSGLKPRSAQAAGAAIDLPAALPDGVRNNAMLDTLPGKKPLIKLSYRPPNYETLIEYLTQRWGNRPAFLWIAERFGVLRLRLMVKQGPHMRPQASEGEAQHGLFCWTRRVAQGDEHLHRG